VDTIAQLQLVLGPEGVRAPGEISERYLGDWFMRAEPGVRPAALTLPRSTEDVSAILKICHAEGNPVVPQGGLTGLAGGGVPIHNCILVSLERMRAIVEIDPVAATMTVEAGIPLQAVQEAAAAAGLLFPLDIGGRGSCQIGGNISTNAGGNRVLRFGMMRDLILGIEAVLADGTIVTSLNKMLKNNAAYDVKQLFIGSEGTLGVVTRAVLRLFPNPTSLCTALCAVADFDQVYDLLGRARAELGGTLSAFEVMWPAFYRRAIAGRRKVPLGPDFGAYVLIESMGSDQMRDSDRFNEFVERAGEHGVLADAVIARSLSEGLALWSIRDASGDLVKELAPVANFDVSVETGRTGAFAQECGDRLRARFAGAAAICFGHLADSNLHIFVTAAVRPFPEREIDEIVYGCVRDWGGSISAEHGIGLVKKPYLSYSRSPAEIAVMKALKAALDPRGILNPGKVFD
jgi:FAD/FMN-containing dehydrogenase